MKIAAFFSDSPFASWGQSHGFAAVLRRMGHEVADIPVPAGYRQMRQIKRAVLDKINKPIDDCELILVSGPEHLKGWIEQFYPQWVKLEAPKVGWYHESFVREDYTLNFDDYRSMFDFHVFPDADDAKKYGGTHLSLGVDAEMFRTAEMFPPSNPYWTDPNGFWKSNRRDIDCAFIGLMYPKRQRFYEALRPHLNGLAIKMPPGGVLVHDMDGMNVQKTAELLAEQYRRIKVFVAFPTLSNVLVAKPLEAGACGCAVVTDKSHGLKNVVTYDEQRPETLVDIVRHLLTNDAAREQLARDLCEEVHREHRMELRFEKIFKITAGVTEKPWAAHIGMASL